MTGRELSEKFRSLESHLAKEKGDFVLFALFLREDAPDYWDLIVSASWLDTDKRRAVDFLVEQIKSQLGEDVLVDLSTIIVADPRDAAVQALNRSIATEHGQIEVTDSEFFGIPVKRAYIITSKLSPAPAAA